MTDTDHDVSIKGEQIDLTTSQSFRQPRNPQASSKLMRIPAEIRIKILRRLLKHEGPLPDDQSVMLSLQVLSCCQQLLDEGQHVLYAENTLSVCVCWLPESMRCLGQCSILDLRTEIRLNATSYGVDGASLGDVAKIPRTAWDLYPGQQWRRTYPALQKMQKLRVSVLLKEQEHVFGACRVLEELVQGKHVLIEARVWPSEQPLPVQWLKSFRGWRCRSIEFANIPQLETEGIVKDIISQSKPHRGLLSEWQALAVETISKLGFLNGCRFRERLENLEKDKALWQALLDHDLEHFNAAKRELCAAIIGWNAQWALEGPVLVRELAEERCMNIRQISDDIVARVTSLQTPSQS